MKFSTKDIILMFILVIATWVAMFLFGFQLAKRSNTAQEFSKCDLSKCLTEFTDCKKNYQLLKDEEIVAEKKSEDINVNNKIQEKKEIPKTIKNTQKKETTVNILKQKQIKPKEKDPKSLSLDVLSPDMKNKYTVQIGAFKNEYDAQQLTFALYQKGFKDSYYRSTKILGKGLWYRVAVGFFSRRSSAEVFANMLLNKGEIKSYAIRKL